MAMAATSLGLGPSLLLLLLLLLAAAGAFPSSPARAPLLRTSTPFPSPVASGIGGAGLGAGGAARRSKPSDDDDDGADDRRSRSRLPPHLRTRPLPPLRSPPNFLQKLSLRLGFGKRLRERVVHGYFHGVDAKDVPQIVACFHPDGAVIRDVCSVANRDVDYDEVGKNVSAEFLGERCREFLGAHPDARVMFHYGPTCGRGRRNDWVYAHWYEEGTWSGTSNGIEPDGSPLTVQGQTRFRVDDDLRIREIVITRTFSRWEEASLRRGTST